MDNELSLVMANIARVRKGARALVPRRTSLGGTTLSARARALLALNLRLPPGKQGAIVFDPFVGTGSILVAAAQFGARLCVGTDIDGLSSCQGSCDGGSVGPS